jgi:D-alanyl-D-alanine carboxypeptidase/D-alanyl-D-alanine-endopeptidase (penicillin-binding protein 4)
VLKGDLIVHGDRDPEFQPENGIMVAEALNRIGIRRITGSARRTAGFWMDGRTGRRAHRRSRPAWDADGTRLRQSGHTPWTARDPHRVAGSQASDRNHEHRAAFGRSARQRTIRGGSRRRRTVLFDHRSKPLAETLRRFNAFSNNDIERVAASIGSPTELSVLLADRLVPGTTPVMVQTASGLGENRLSPRQIVRDGCAASARPRPSAGSGSRACCRSPGAIREPWTPRFPRLSLSAFCDVARRKKTGTLTSTDGGITVLAGFLTPPRAR